MRFLVIISPINRFNHILSCIQINHPPGEFLRLSISPAVLSKSWMPKLKPPISLSRSMTLAMRSILAAPAMKKPSTASSKAALCRGSNLSSSMHTRSAVSPSLLISRLAFCAKYYDKYEASILHRRFRSLSAITSFLHLFCTAWRMYDEDTAAISPCPSVHLDFQSEITVRDEEFKSSFHRQYSGLLYTSNLNQETQ